jgi:Flp pilus assembly pilin Flp
MILQRFRADQSGAVTVDWIVLAAVLVSITISSMAAIAGVASSTAESAVAVAEPAQVRDCASAAMQAGTGCAAVKPRPRQAVARPLPTAMRFTRTDF